MAFRPNHAAPVGRSVASVAKSVAKHILQDKDDLASV